jgi:putative peptidoglycan lipid II flippase
VGAAPRGLPAALPPPRLTPELKRLLIIAAPAVLAGGVVQINLIVGRQVASFTENAISWLSYADRLYQLPLGVVGIAVGVVLLPELSRRLRAGEEAGARDAFSRGMEFALALTVPSAVALVVIAQPIVSVLFERGAFGPGRRGNTALALASTAPACRPSCCTRCCSPSTSRARTPAARSATRSIRWWSTPSSRSG